MADVLVVDDDAAIRRLITSVLQRGGHSVELAEDGVQALEKLHARVYAAVILDLMMPRVTGWDVLDRLAKDDPSRLRCFIVLSAAIPRKGLTPEREAQVYAVLSKPFDVEILTDTIRACVDGVDPRPGESS
jgi:CheY-like chemotaxis protein